MLIEISTDHQYNSSLACVRTNVWKIKSKLENITPRGNDEWKTFLAWLVMFLHLHLVERLRIEEENVVHEMKLMKTVQRRQKGKEATNFCQMIEGCNF